MILGIDTAARITADQALAMKAAGYDFAGRYLVPSGWKALTKQEAKDLTDAGLKILAVWETTADRTKGGAAAGASDGAMALKCAQKIDMPTSGIIYFAVDFGAQAGDMDAIEAYLQAARANTEQYEIGVYGPYNVIEEMAKRKACKAFWQCVGWSYGKISSHLNTYQAQWGKRVAGVEVDINECADMDAAGIWDYEEDNMNIERFKELWNEFRKELQDNDASEYSAAAREWAVNTGLVAGGASNEFNGMWEDVLTREQFVTVLYRFVQMYGLN